MENSGKENTARAMEEKLQSTKEAYKISETLKSLSTLFFWAGIIGCVGEVFMMEITVNDMYGDLVSITVISMLTKAVICLVTGVSLSAILKAFSSIVADLNAIREHCERHGDN